MAIGNSIDKRLLLHVFLVLFDIVDASKNECPWDIVNIALSHLMGAIATENPDPDQIDGIWLVSPMRCGAKYEEDKLLSFRIG